MIEKRFETAGQMADEWFAFLSDYLSRTSETPYAVMLSGGHTPIPVYRRLAAHPPAIRPTLHLLFTDERMVPDDSPESNYGKARELIDAIKIPPERVLRVHTDLPTVEAAERYHKDLDKFFGKGGRIGLGLLGLGSEGHTASLFTRDDVRRGVGRWAIPVLRAAPQERVSVTCDLLARAESLVFALAGPDKREIAEAFLRDPESFPAGLAVADARNVELWFCPEPIS